MNTYGAEPTHRYRVGQMVRIVSFSISARYKSSNAFPREAFEVVRLLPPEHGYCQYRIQSSHDQHERVVVESEISLV